MTKPVRSAGGFLRRFAAASRGNVAMIFALMLPVLVILTMGGVDISRATTVRGHLQDALDAAALAAARSPYITNAELTDVGLRSLRGNMPGYFAEGSADTATFTLDPNQVVIANATVNINTLVANIILPPYGQILDDTLPVGTHSEVNRSSKNVEIALVLDVTGSMAGSRMTALKAAATDLIDIVVQPPAKQTPYYSKAAIIPYSIGVNAGTYADQVRGTLRSTTSITDAQWASDTAKAISKVDKNTNPAVVTSNGHGLETGNHVWVTGVSNVPNGFNNKIYRITKIDANQFRLDGAASASNNGSGGTVRKCIRSDCTVVVTSAGHGLSDNDYVFIQGVRGMTALNNTTSQSSNWMVDQIDSRSFQVNLLGPTQAAYTSGGTAQCGFDGCAMRIFVNASGTLRRVATGTTCVTDRAGVAAYTDAMPEAGSWLGRLYRTSDACSSREFTPLWDDKDELVAEIDRLQPAGSTAGQIGLAWGWYALSNNFSSLWPTGRSGAVDDPTQTLKAIILMTDGEFNTTYCQGVLAANANYDGNSNQINCNATNGNPFEQTAQLCERIKAVRKSGDGPGDSPAILIYTVGLSVSTSRGGAGIDTAREVLEACASTPDRARFATNSAQLSGAFVDFARDITRLRISK